LLLLAALAAVGIERRGKDKGVNPGETAGQEKGGEQ
jgi:hypothetical protein